MQVVDVARVERRATTAHQRQSEAEVGAAMSQGSYHLPLQRRGNKR
jgi:hypothetical protein